MCQTGKRIHFYSRIEPNSALTSVKYSKETNVECVMSELVVLSASPCLSPVANGDTSKLEKGQDPIKEIKAP